MNVVLIEDTGDALLVRVDGDTLPALQTLVDGLVDIVVAPPLDVWVNDEGYWRESFGINLVASILTGRQLVGPAVLARSCRQGKTTGLSTVDVRRLQRSGLAIDTNDGRGYTPDEAVALREAREGEG